jgi:4-amino-4-deoxy-L-arabinose transferase-like glycosyltransferase
VQEVPILAPGQSAPDLTTLADNVQKRDLWFGGEAPFSPEEEITAHTSPGYPHVVGLIGQFAGEGERDFMVRWVQVGLGSLTAVFYYLFARRAFRSLLVGTLAGLFAALHPFWIFDVATLSEAPLASCALAFSLLMASQAGEKGGALKSLLLGGSLAGLSLVRASYLPFAFVLLIWFLLRSRNLRMGWLCALCAFLGFGTALAPWTIRNYEVYEEPVPIVTSTYLHLWIGNNALANGGPPTDAMYAALPVHELQGIPGQPARYGRLGRDVVEFAQMKPITTLELRVNAALYFLFGERWFTHEGQLAELNSASGELPEWLRNSYEGTLAGVLIGMLLLAFLGWRWSYGWRWESVPAALAVMWVPLPYILSHSTGLSGARLPLDGVLLCFAAFAISCFLPGGGARLAGAEAQPSRDRR